MSPGREKLFGRRARRRLRIFARRCGYRTDDGSAPWRANPSYPEGKKTGLPGAAIKNTGNRAWLFDWLFDK